LIDEEDVDSCCPGPTGRSDLARSGPDPAAILAGGFLAILAGGFLAILAGSFSVVSRLIDSICTTGITQARIMVFVPRALHIFSVLVAFSILGLGLPHGAFSSFRTRDPTSSCFPRDWGLMCYSFALENVPAA